jgi:hypothetical protein
MTGPAVPLRPRRWTRFVAALALLLAVRALVPAGFMASTTEQGLQLVFCEAGVATSHAHGHPHHHTDRGSPDPGCPYAQSAGPAPLPTLPALAAEVPAAGFVATFTPAPVAVLQGPPRQQTPRGPPLLA